MITKSKILITGGYGFIGAHLARNLASDKQNTIVILDQTLKTETAGYDLQLNSYSNISAIQGSILNIEDVEKLDKDFDFILHCAGYLGIHNVAENQLLSMDVNVLGTRNVLELARQQKMLKLYIQMSTSEIYGVDAPYACEDDDSVIKTVGKRWVYAASKLGAEYYTKAYMQKYDLKAAIVRPFNVYGPHRYGSNAMSALISRALQDRDLLLSGDGQQLRAWCHIEDFCAAILSMLDSSQKIIGETFNIGDDQSFLTLESLANKILELTKSKAKIIYQFDATEDVKERRPNIEKAKVLLGYTPTIKLDKGISEVTAWLKSKMENT